jgi:F-type H+-transporting ATPase subunit delta
MAAGTIAGVYATALLEVARERGTYEAVVTSCRALAAAWPAATMRELDDPRVGRVRAKEILRVVLADHPREIVDFFQLLVDRNRLPDAPAILAMVDDLDDQAKNVVEVTITAAAPLSEVSRTALANQLKHRVPMTCELFEVVDPTLLGGYTFRMGDYYVDASVRRRLNEMRSQMLTTPINDSLWTGASA